MTGKELIIYILENNLLNVSVFEDNSIVGLLTTDQAAIKLNVGKATITAYVMTKRLDEVVIGGKTFIIDNARLKELKGAIK